MIDRFHITGCELFDQINFFPFLTGNENLTVWQVMNREIRGNIKRLTISDIHLEPQYEIALKCSYPQLEISIKGVKEPVIRYGENRIIRASQLQQALTPLNRGGISPLVTSLRVMDVNQRCIQIHNDLHNPTLQQIAYHSYLLSRLPDEITSLCIKGSLLPLSWPSQLRVLDITVRGILPQFPEGIEDITLFHSVSSSDQPNLLVMPFQCIPKSCKSFHICVSDRLLIEKNAFVGTPDKITLHPFMSPEIKIYGHEIRAKQLFCDVPKFHVKQITVDSCWFRNVRDFKVKRFHHTKVMNLSDCHFTDLQSFLPRDIVCLHMMRFHGDNAIGRILDLSSFLNLKVLSINHPCIMPEQLDVLIAHKIERFLDRVPTNIKRLDITSTVELDLSRFVHLIALQIGLFTDDTWVSIPSSVRYLSVGQPLNTWPEKLKCLNISKPYQPNTVSKSITSLPQSLSILLTEQSRLPDTKVLSDACKFVHTDKEIVPFSYLMHSFIRYPDAAKWFSWQFQKEEDNTLPNDDDDDDDDDDTCESESESDDDSVDPDDLIPSSQPKRKLQRI